MHQLRIGFKHTRWLLIVFTLLITIFTMALGTSHSQVAKAATLSPNATSSATQCSSLGHLIEVDPVMANGTQIGEVDTYWNNSTGYNCAILTTTGPAWGKASAIDVMIVLCQLSTASVGSGCYGNVYDADPSSFRISPQPADLGSYHYYAGPVGISARKQCIYVEGVIVWQGQKYYGRTRDLRGHCA